MESLREQGWAVAVGHDASRFSRQAGSLGQPADAATMSFKFAEIVQGSCVMGMSGCAIRQRMDLATGNRLVDPSSEAGVQAKYANAAERNDAHAAVKFADPWQVSNGQVRYFSPSGTGASDLCGISICAFRAWIFWRRMAMAWRVDSMISIVGNGAGRWCCVGAVQESGVPDRVPV